jgi:hypothetical protein
MSGGKGGSQSSQVEIPDWIEQPASRNLLRAEKLGQIGYLPNYGPQVAAFSPTQLQAMNLAGTQAQAFGLAPEGFNVTAGMPEATTYAGGIQGYGSGDLFEQALQELSLRQPGQYKAFSNQFIGPNYDGQNRQVGFNIPMGSYLGNMNSSSSLPYGSFGYNNPYFGFNNTNDMRAMYNPLSTDTVL